MTKFSTDVEVTSKLKFQPVPELNNLCAGKLVSVEVKMSDPAKVKDDATWEYAKLAIPTIYFNFENVKLNKDDADRYFSHRETVITCVRGDGTAMETKLVLGFLDNMWKRILHIYKAYEKCPNYKALTVVPDVDETADAVTRIAQFTAFFNFIANSFNKGLGDKPIYTATDGNPIDMIMKIVAEYKDAKYFVFPSFVGEGFIELLKFDSNKKLKTTLEIKPNDNIHLSQKEKAKVAAPGATNTQQGAMSYVDQLIAETNA